MVMEPLEDMKLQPMEPPSYNRKCERSWALPMFASSHDRSPTTIARQEGLKTFKRRHGEPVVDGAAVVELHKV